MSERQKQNLSAYILMLGVISLVFSAIIPSIVKNTIENVTSVPVIIERLDTVVNNQNLILEAQTDLQASKLLCMSKAKECREDIRALELRFNKAAK